MSLSRLIPNIIRLFPLDLIQKSSVPSNLLFNFVTGTWYSLAVCLRPFFYNVTSCFPHSTLFSHSGPRGASELVLINHCSVFLPSLMGSLGVWLHGLPFSYCTAFVSTFGRSSIFCVSSTKRYGLKSKSMNCLQCCTPYYMLTVRLIPLPDLLSANVLIEWLSKLLDSKLPS